MSSMGSSGKEIHQKACLEEVISFKEGKANFD